MVANKSQVGFISLLQLCLIFFSVLDFSPNYIFPVVHFCSFYYVTNGGAVYYLFFGFNVVQARSIQFLINKSVFCRNYLVGSVLFCSFSAKADL